MTAPVLEAWGGSPLVSILVCTCNRQANIVPTIRSILASDYSSFELLILDQSKADDTRQAVTDAYGNDDRVTYVRLEKPSKPGALNHGRKLARGQYILLTDDDCEVASDWVTAMVGAFGDDQRIGCVFGDVAAAPHERTEGYIPDCRIARSHLIFAVAEFMTMPGWGNFGIGANMAIRASFLGELGGWDPCFGPGSRFGSGDDIDTAVRMLAAGHVVAFCADSHTVHYGFRYWKSARQDQARTGLGLGAMFAKHLRCGTYQTGALGAVADAARECGRRALRGERPLGLTYPTSWVRGFWAGLRQPVDRKASQFVATGDARSPGVAEVVLRSRQKNPPM